MSETSDAVGVLKQVRELRRKQNQVRVAGTLFLLFIFVSYGSCIYRVFSGFDQTRFKDAVADRADRTLDMLGKDVQATAAHLLPVYTDALVKQLEPGVQQLQSRIANELGQLGQNMQTNLTLRTQGLQKAVSTHIDQRLQERYPKMSPEGRGRVRDAILIDVERSVTARLRQRIERPAKEITGLLETTVTLSEHAKRQAGGQKFDAQERMLFALLGVISREIIDQRALLQKELAN